MHNAQLAGLDVSRETISRLKHFEALVRKWTKGINLVSPASLPDLWDRHIVDSAQILRLIPHTFSTWADLGSGGGFPGIVVAAISKEITPHARFTLIESDQRKATFLRTAARELDLSVSILAQRIDKVEGLRADIVSARALSSLADLLPQVDRHLGATGIAILHKGRRYAAEIVAARADWTFDLEEYPSITDADARILTIQRISRA